jgi:hypothetical protein
MKISVQAEEQSRLVYCGMAIVSYMLWCFCSIILVSLQDEAIKRLYGDRGASLPLWPDEV